MILEEKIIVKWTNSNRKHYENLGYLYTGLFDEFTIFIDDLPKNSGIRISVKCDGCGKHIKTSYSNYNKYVVDSKYYCQACSRKNGFNAVVSNRIKNNLTYSFYDWCIKNNRNDALERWDYELNSVLPNNISFSSNKKYYFKCPRNLHGSELKNIHSMTQRENSIVPCSKCNTFAQLLIDRYGEEAINLYWGNKNAFSPWEITTCAKVKIYIKCQHKDYHSEYETTPSLFKQSKYCPYCSGHKVHPLDSFAQYCIDNVDKNFMEKYWDYENNNKLGVDPYQLPLFTKKSVYIICQCVDYHGSYLIRVDSFVSGIRCSYCGNKNVHRFDSLGFKHPYVYENWSNKNKFSPLNYSPNSAKKVWWKCENNKHEDYFRSIGASMYAKFHCPECIRIKNESYLQEKVRNYFDRLGYSLNHEHNCTLKCRNPKSNALLPFDNEIIELNLYCEVMGKQHYKPTKFFSHRSDEKLMEDFKELKYRDEYKKDFVLSNDCHYLEIPYWTEKDESYKTIIDNKISEILSFSVYEVM